MPANSRIKPIERATSRTWDEWLKFMDDIGAKNLTHHEIATKVLEDLMDKIDNPGWWTQSITTAYKQYIGQTIPGQRPDGTFQTSVSKATKLGMQALMDQWIEFAAGDQEIIDLIAKEAKVSGTANRITWRTNATDDSEIRVISEPKKDGTASMVIQLLGLATNELNMEAKARWSSILQRFLAGL